jgi:hypothetical protein
MSGKKDKIRDIEVLLGKMRRFLKRRGNPYAPESFCLVCGKKATRACYTKDHPTLFEDYETPQVTDWVEAIEWVLAQIKGGGR